MHESPESPEPPGSFDAPDEPGSTTDPPPFPPELLQTAIREAASLWEPLAARAWEETGRRGRGLLALRWNELTAAAAEHAASRAAGRPAPEPPATWIPLTIVSRGDDFRGLLKSYDPHRQVMLLVAHADGGEAVFGLECDGDRRPTPEACHARRVAADGSGAAGDDAP